MIGLKKYENDEPQRHRGHKGKQLIFSVNSVSLWFNYFSCFNWTY
jgi:hypothetical protein